MSEFPTSPVIHHRSWMRRATLIAASFAICLCSGCQRPGIPQNKNGQVDTSRTGQVLPASAHRALLAGNNEGRYGPMTDTRGDGFPDAAHLNASDQQNFRNWFSYIAESAFQSSHPPPGVTDCAGLVRYAFTEALRRHDARWRREFGRPIYLASGDVQAWNYPDGPLGVDLFRVRPGSFQPEDERNGTFRQFADAHALWAYNTVFVSRQPNQARQGDLLFFFQPGQKEPFHTMIYLRHSYFFPHVNSAFVVYDTGDLGNGRSEIRMTPLSVLDHFPDPRWRPLRSNPHFLGFYRWKIISNR